MWGAYILFVRGRLRFAGDMAIKYTFLREKWLSFSFLILENKLQDDNFIFLHVFFPHTLLQQLMKQTLKRCVEMELVLFSSFSFF